jgi:2-dehydropantoate 2-reductase
MSITKIAVLGTGANGASIAADFVKAGLDVTLIEQWPDHVEAMNKNGLTVKMPDRTEHTEVYAIHLCQVAELKTTFDLVFILVKAYDTRWAAELIKPVLSDSAIVVGLQNGMSINDLADVLGPDRSMGAVIECCSNMFEPGVCIRETPPEESWFGLGGLSEISHSRAEEVAEILRHAGTVQVYDDIRSAKWMKLVANASELVTSAILDVPLFDAVADPKMRKFMEDNAKEALAVCLAGGSRIVPIFGFTVADQEPDTYAVNLLNEVLKRFSFPDTLTTVLQDWRKGRRAEINDINGLVVSEGLRLGIPTPANSMTLRLASEIESGVRKAEPGNLAEILEYRNGT